MSHRRLGSLLIAAATVLALPATTTAATINFGALQTLGTPGSAFNGNLRGFGTSLSYAGLDFLSTNNVSFGLSVWEAADPNHPVGGTPSTSLFEYAAGFQVDIQRTGGGEFDLLAIDLANWGVNPGNFPPTYTVTFVGTRADDSTVSQTFTVTNSGGSPILQSFLFSGFNNLVNVNMTQGTYAAGAAFQFNNLVTNVGDQTPVPEPASLLLMGAGLTGLATRLRRSRR